MDVEVINYLLLLNFWGKYFMHIQNKVNRVGVVFFVGWCSSNCIFVINVPEQMLQRTIDYWSD